ncbi:hypothetical protein KR767_01030 [Luteibacter anthropi]|uniref:hypothetical protein n=1 Tax=Luteibacter anthropi TaxID=564369 RepID=UPI002032ED72|nr:hypothetical protein [Luteibacter anthropi]URX62695.1 hypothetical protein KR767_01030 [Luteibacter anthropi]
MTLRKEWIAALALTALAGPALAQSLQPDTQEYKISDSSQTFVLTPGSKLYEQWAAWIKHQQATTRKADGTPWGTEAGQISITMTTSSADAKQAMAAQAGVPQDKGPPVRLPLSGEEGQIIELIDQSPAVFQQWIYEWHGKAGSAGGWSEKSYAARACAVSDDTGKLCPSPPK